MSETLRRLDDLADVPRWERRGSSGPDWSAWLSEVAPKLVTSPGALSGDVTIPAMWVRDIAGLMAKLDRLCTYTCRECGTATRVSTERFVGEAKRMAAKLCWHCAFWTDVLDTYRSNRRCFVDPHGRHYTALERQPNRNLAGMYGAEGVVRFDDGGVIETNNIWDQGEVPELFADRFDRRATIEWRR